MLIRAYERMERGKGVVEGGGRELYTEPGGGTARPRAFLGRKDPGDRAPSPAWISPACLPAFPPITRGFPAFGSCLDQAATTWCYLWLIDLLFSPSPSGF